MPLNPFAKKRAPINTPTIDLETALSHLGLETVDQTQTAFAVSGVHISERTAFSWREMARENSFQSKLLEDDTQEDQSDAKCFQRLLGAFRR